LAIQGHVDSLGSDKANARDLYDEFGQQMFSADHWRFASDILNAFLNTDELARTLFATGNSRNRSIAWEIRDNQNADTPQSRMTARRIADNFRTNAFNEALRRMDPQQKRANMLRRSTPVSELEFTD